MRATVHDDFTVRITPPHPNTNMLNIIFRDITEDGAAMGFQEVYPMDADQLKKFVEEANKKLSGIEVVGADAMPKRPDLRSVE